MFLSALAENAAYLGNPLSFTNVAVQPKKHVFRWITHSNVDWRQNEDRADTYLARAGIGRDRLDPPHVLPGRNLLRHYHAAGNLRFERYRWVRENVDPVAHFDHTFLLFDLSPADFDRYLDAERRLAPSPRADELCGAGEPGQALAAAEPFTLPDEPGRPQAWVLCVDAPRGADFILHVESGQHGLRPGRSARRRSRIRGGRPGDLVPARPRRVRVLRRARGRFPRHLARGPGGAPRSPSGSPPRTSCPASPSAGRSQRVQLEVRLRTLHSAMARERQVERVLLIGDAGARPTR